MTTVELVVTISIFVFAGFCAFISARQFAGKGFLFNNAYIWASKEERARMDKKPYYRQSAIVFCLISVTFLVLGISVILHNRIIQLMEIPLIIGTLIYAVVSSVRIEKNKKK